MDPETRSDVRRDGFSRRVSPQKPAAALHTLQTHSARSYCGAQVVTIQPRSHAADHPWIVVATAVMTVAAVTNTAATRCQNVSEKCLTSMGRPSQ